MSRGSTTSSLKVLTLISPESPFRKGDTGKSVTDLKLLLSLMGDGPVLPDGSQGGQATTVASAADAVQAYLNDLSDARDILQEAYGFDAEVVKVW